MQVSQQQVCLICGEPAEGRTVEHIDRRKGLVGKWTTNECMHCGVEAINPFPSETELSEYYLAYSHNQSVVFSPRSGSRFPRMRRLYHWLSGDVDPRDFIAPKPNAKMLDYGCGEAGTLHDFHMRGIQISGAEISAEMVVACRRAGLDVHQVIDFGRIPFGDEEFDIVYLMQVFEHLRAPHEFLKELHRIVKVGGELYIAVPNSRSIWKTVFGKNWVSGWFAPFHLFHYDKDSLMKLAHQHGFEVLDAWSRTPESWFRLNLKAWFYPTETRLDERVSVIDTRFVRILLMIVLRVSELFTSQRDCLVIKLGKRGN